MHLWAMQEIGILGTWLAWGEVGGTGMEQQWGAHPQPTLLYCTALQALNYQQ